MHLTDLNTARDIGSNCFLVELGSFRFVIDVGLHPQKIGMAAMPHLAKANEQILDFIFITHSHLDHIGSLPVLARHHPQAPIISTFPTQLLTVRMLRNSLRVMHRQREEQNIPDYPLYTQADIQRVERNFTSLAFHSTHTFTKHNEDLKVTFFPAGHIAGAAGILFEYKRQRIFFSGDVLFDAQHTVCAAQFPQEPVDTLILETTRGANQRPDGTNRHTEENRLLQAIHHTLQRGGSCLLPVFALGRTQEILTILHKAYQTKSLPKVPIFCSGLGIDLVDYYDEISRKTPTVHFRRKIIQELGAKTLAKDIIPGQDLKGPAIYVLSNGMMVQNTPSYFVASALLDHPKNSILFVGYCDPDTPGGKLIKCAQGDPFLFESLRHTALVRAEIDHFDLSAHANREDLIHFAYSMSPRTLLLSHGSPEAREWVTDALCALGLKSKIIDPTPSERIPI